MKIKKFNQVKDLKQIKNWLDARGLNNSLAYDLPEFGLVVTEGDTYIAAGFLRKIEGGSAMVDSLITNPNIQPHIRHEALDRLVSKLIKIATHYKVKQLIAYTTDLNTLVRSYAHNFIEAPHKVIVLRIGD